MENAAYIGLSRQMTLRRELDVVANNIANADTTGFKVEQLLVGEEIGVGASGRWARFHGIRTSTADDRPIAVTDAYIHPDLMAAADAIDPAGATIFRQLETLSKLKIARVTQDIQAVPASTAIATALGVVRRSPCLLILRCYCDAGGRVIEISASHHPGDRFAYNMHIEVEG